MESAAEILCPSQEHLLTKVSLSRVAAARRIVQFVEDVGNTFKYCASKFAFYSIALNESTDITDKAQVATVIRRIDDDFNITEEIPIKDNDLLNALKSVLRPFNLMLNNLSGVVTDGPPVMMREDKGLVALIRKEANVCENGQLMLYY
jgi:hypothetical protein